MKELALSEITASLRAERYMERILEQHAIVEQARDACLAWAHRGMSALVAAGELLIEAREKLSGDFGDWLSAFLGSLPPEKKFSQATAYNYMRATRYKQSLAATDPDFASIKELYIAAGILPLPPASGSGGSGQPAPTFTLSLRLNAPEPEKWESLDRREFLQKAKPVVDLYARVQAAEDAA